MDFKNNSFGDFYLPMKTTTGIALPMVLRHLITVFVKSTDLWQIEKGRVYCVLKQNISSCNYSVIVLTAKLFPLGGIICLLMLIDYYWFEHYTKVMNYDGSAIFNVTLYSLPHISFKDAFDTNLSFLFLWTVLTIAFYSQLSESS